MMKHRKTAGRIFRRGGPAIIIHLLLLLLAGCVSTRPTLHPPLSTESELFVYLAPLAQDADRFSLSLGGVAAVRSDGSEVPLQLLLDTPTNGQRDRQRLLARGVLSPGLYKGIRFRLARATVDTEEGPAALLVSETGEESPLRFELLPRKGMVIEAAFSGTAARSNGFSLRPAFSLAVPPPPLPSLTGYLTLPAGNRVLVFDKRNGTVGRSIATGAEPRGVVFDPGGRHAYLALSGEDAISVIDLSNHEIHHRIRMNPGDFPTEMAMAGDGSILLVVNEGSNTLSFIDPVGLRETGRINTGFAPKGIAVNRSGNLVCVCNSGSRNVTLIDIASRQQLMEYPTDPNPLACQFSANGNRLLVGHGQSHYLFVYDLSRRNLLDRLAVFGGVTALKTDYKSDRFYVAPAIGGNLAIFNQLLQAPIDFVASRTVTSQLAIDGAENTMLAVQPEERNLRIIDLVSRSEKGIVDAGDTPFRVTVAGER